MSLFSTLLRATAFNLFFFVLTVVMGVAAFPIRWFAPGRALPYAKLWAGTTVKGLQRICGVELRITGLEHLAGDAPVLIASQHQSAFDTLVWMNLVPRPAYVMKKELTRLPLVGPMLLLAGMIPLEREGGAKALRDLLRDTASAVADRRQIIIFPEGTRVRAGEQVPLQAGIAALASHSGLAVLPVATDSGRCWSRNAFIKRKGPLHIDIGAPIPAGLKRAALLAAIREGWDTLEQQRLGRTGPQACG
ncbi:1-acyl-sn-glycerol-3-phosphate acyltransferase [Acetobacteraceae bacterium KSS8]|uniref:1-acyl-sn-glycerol-3-phosphate acyltransferase n=1 Tax=Endosaccharibacter trunci TaxID=2812733 RepID=A0ABT1W771_9PROT|nr:1-acyl-sn-glycerol-3-phosphate acyltransferase [Acetobacteraceae bacterium KSS8]